MSPEGPDTEPTAPLTPPGDHISVELEVPSSSIAKEAQVPDDVAPGTRRTAPPTMKDVATLGGAAATQPIQAPDRLRPETTSKNTTLQSMRKPDVGSGGVPHSRRFLSIEYELSDFSVTVKLLEKRVAGLERNLRIALIAATAAGLLAIAAFAL